ESLALFHEHLSKYTCSELAAKLKISVPVQDTSSSVIEFGSSSDYQIHKEILLPLRRHATELWKRTATVLTEHERAEHLIRGAQAACTYYYGLASICLAFRAAGCSTEYEELGLNRLRVHEKNSKIFREQRLGLMSQVARQQRDVVV